MEKTKVSECCNARIEDDACVDCGELCKGKVCPDCDGTGEVTEDAGFCGGCETCGSREAKEVPCPTCQNVQEPE